jgi:hypothetical protein
LTTTGNQAFRRSTKPPPSKIRDVNFTASGACPSGVIERYSQRRHAHCRQADGSDNGAALMQFAVGFKLQGTAGHAVVDAEDALIAALKIKRSGRKP